MYNSFTLAAKYLRYYFTASNGKGHGIHSPFVFDFITTVLNDKQHYPAYDAVEKLRKDLLKDQRVLTVQDFGAGSSSGRSDRRSVASIAKNAAKSKKYGQLLYRIAKKYQPPVALEMGMSLGITTGYLASALAKGSVVSFEGATEVAAIAKQNFHSLQLQNIMVVEGNFDNTFPAMVNDLFPVYFCFIDGNHRREPTERYFNQLLVKADVNTILIFDDIHWSREMEEAWDIIRAHPAVRCTIDLFFIGIVFFREEFREKQDFVIRF